MSMPYTFLLEQEQPGQREQQQHQQLQTNWLEHGQIVQSTATLQPNSCANNFLVSPMPCIDHQQQHQQHQQHHQHQQQTFELFQNTDLQQFSHSGDTADVHPFLAQYSGDGDGDGLHIPAGVPFASDHVSRQMQQKMPLVGFEDNSNLAELFAGPSSSRSSAAQQRFAFFDGPGMGPNHYVRHIGTQALELQAENLLTNSNKLVLSDPQEFPTLAENMHKKKKFKSRQIQKPLQQQQQQQQQTNSDDMKCQFFFETEPPSMQQQQTTEAHEEEQQQFDFTALNAVNDQNSDQGFSSSNQSTPQQQNEEDTVEPNEHFPTYFTNNRRYYYGHYASEKPPRFQQQKRQQQQQLQTQQQHQPHWTEYSRRRSFYNKQSPNDNYSSNQFEAQYYQRPNGYYKNGSYYHQHPLRKYRQQQQQQQQQHQQQQSQQYYGCHPRNQFRLQQQQQPYLPLGIQSAQIDSSEQPMLQTLPLPLLPNSDSHTTPHNGVQRRHQRSDSQAAQADDLNANPQQPKLQYSDFFKGPFKSEILARDLKRTKMGIEHPKPKQTAAMTLCENSLSTAAQTLQLPETFNKEILSCLSPIGDAIGELSDEAMPVQYLMKPATQSHSLPPPPPLPTELFRFLTQNERRSAMKPTAATLPAQYCTTNTAQPQLPPQNRVPVPLPPRHLTQQQESSSSASQNQMWHAVSNFSPQNRLKPAVLQNKQQQQQLTLTPAAENPPIYQQHQQQQRRSAHWRTIINAEDVNTFLNTYEQRRQQQAKQQLQFEQKILQPQQQTPAANPPLMLAESKTQLVVASKPSPSPPSPTAQRPQLEFRPAENVVANIPTTMLSDQYGIAGLYAAIKRAETNQNFAEMVFGIDLESLSPSYNNNATTTNGQPAAASPQPVLPHFSGPLADEELPHMQYTRFPSPTPSSNPAQAGSFSGSCSDTVSEISLPCCYGYPLSDFVRQSLTPPTMVILTDEQLFLVFYTQVGDLAQLLSAEELYNREWAYYLVERAWIKHYRGFSYVRFDEHYERGYYMCFDASNWCLFSRYMKIDLDQINAPPHIPQKYRE